MIWRVYVRVGGAHVHCRVFCAPAQNTEAANCGTLVVSVGEQFSSLMRAFPRATFIDDEPGAMLRACEPWRAA